MDFGWYVGGKFVRDHGFEPFYRTLLPPYMQPTYRTKSDRTDSETIKTGGRKSGENYG